MFVNYLENSVFFTPKKGKSKIKVFTFVYENDRTIFPKFALIGNKKIFDFRLIGK